MYIVYIVFSLAVLRFSFYINMQYFWIFDDNTFKFRFNIMTIQLTSTDIEDFIFVI